MEHGARSSGLQKNGFGESPKPTGQRPVLPMAIVAHGQAGRVARVPGPTWKSARQVDIGGQGQPAAVLLVGIRLWASVVWPFWRSMWW